MKFVVLDSYMDSRERYGPRLAKALRSRGHSVRMDYDPGDRPDAVIMIDLYVGMGRSRRKWIQSELLPAGIPYVIIARNEDLRNAGKPVRKGALATFTRQEIFNSRWLPSREVVCLPKDGKLIELYPLGDRLSIGARYAPIVEALGKLS